MIRSFSGRKRRWCALTGIAAAECPGILDVVAEPDIVRLELRTGSITNTRTGATISGSALPEELIAIIDDGGLLQRLERGGYLQVTRRS